MSSFKNYSNYYNLIYQDKNYRQEISFLEKVIKKYSSFSVKSILSLGCGTANHEIILSKKGYKITGIDYSKKMLEIAKEKTRTNNLDIKFKLADIADFKVDKKFDLAIAMFNVIGYQTKNKTIEETLQNISNSLRNNALFVFDCWYGPAVLKDRPVNKIKKLNKEITRTTKSRLDIKNSIININFKILSKENNKKRKIIQENHEVRFWYLPELKYFLSQAGFELVKSCNFMDLNSEISENNWNIFIIARKS